jgi:hypothetical protein
MRQLSFFDPEEAETGPAAISPTAGEAQSILQMPEITWVANFAALSGELVAAETEVFGDNIPADLERKRGRLIAALSAGGTSRFQVGIALAEYKEVYKAQKQWVRCGTPIAKAMGRKGVNSLNNLIRDAQPAAQLPKVLLAVLIEAGIEPVEHKYGAYLKDLKALNFSGGVDEAKAVVEETYARFRAKKREAAQMKKKESKQTSSNSAARIANQFDSSLRNCAEPERPEFLKTTVLQIDAKARKLFPNCKVLVLWSADDAPVSPSGLLGGTRPMLPSKHVADRLSNLEA